MIYKSICWIYIDLVYINGCYLVLCGKHPFFNWFSIVGGDKNIDKIMKSKKFL